MAHGSQKLFGAFGGGGIPGVAQGFAALGLNPPFFWAWIAALTEFLGGLGLLSGLLTRLAGCFIIVLMLVAIAKVHAPRGFFLPGGFEFNYALIAIALALVISGAGPISLDHLVRSRYRSARP